MCGRVMRNRRSDAEARRDAQQGRRNDAAPKLPPLEPRYNCLFGLRVARQAPTAGSRASSVPMSEYGMRISLPTFVAAALAALLPLSAQAQGEQSPHRAIMALFAHPDD